MNNPVVECDGEVPGGTSPPTKAFELQYARRDIGHAGVAEEDRTEFSAWTVKELRPAAFNLAV